MPDQLSVDAYGGIAYMQFFAHAEADRELIVDNAIDYVFRS